ncbi:hypothetical protein JCM6882_003582 [Rhodosporidiobolus microsporus]
MSGYTRITDRSGPIDWTPPAVQAAYRRAVHECYAQRGPYCDSQPRQFIWEVNGAMLPLNQAISRMMQNELNATGHANIAGRYTSNAVASRRNRDRQAAAAAEDGSRWQVAARNTPARVYNPHTPAHREGELVNPVLQPQYRYAGPSAGQVQQHEESSGAQHPDEDYDPRRLTYQGRRSPPQQYIDPRDFHRR